MPARQEPRRALAGQICSRSSFILTSSGDHAPCSWSGGSPAAATMAAWAQVKELFPRLDRELDAWEDDYGRLYRWREETA